MELLRALAVLAERPTAEHGRIADVLELSVPPTQDAWTGTFLLQLFPHASVHLGPEGMLGGVARDRIAGMLRTLQATPPPEPDHLPVLLTAYVDLLERAEGSPDGRAAHGARTMLHEHLLSWLPLWLARVEVIGVAPYDEWAALLAAVLRAQVTEAPEPDLVSSHLQAAPALDDPRRADDESRSHDERGRPQGAGRTLVEQLLVPVRTGMLLTREDLRRASRELRLPGRIGERRYVMEQLLGQDTAAVLRWLAEHAVTTTTAAWEPWREALPRTATWWSDRATATADLLEDLADEAREAFAQTS